MNIIEELSELSLGEEEENFDADLEEFIEGPSTNTSNIQLNEPLLAGAELLKRRKPTSQRNAFIRPYTGNNTTIKDKEDQNKKVKQRIKAGYNQYLKILRQQNSNRDQVLKDRWENQLPSSTNKQ